MLAKTTKRNPVTEFTESIKTALKGKDPAGDIQKSVTVLLNRYGIQAPEK